VSRLLLLVAVAVLEMDNGLPHGGFAVALLYAAGGLLAAASLGARVAAVPAPRWLVRVVAVLVVGGLVALGLARSAALTLGAGAPSWLVVAVFTASSGLAVTAALGAGRGPVVALVVLQALALAVAVHSTPATIDVEAFLREGGRALLHGHDPYALHIENPYSPANTRHYYSPGTVVDGRLVYGFPYLPVSLLVTLPGMLAGDVRLAHLALMVVTSLVLVRIAPDRLGRMLATLVVVSPLSMMVVLESWTEPTLLLGVVLLVWALHRGRPWAGVAGTVLFLGAKQYVVVALPLLAAVRARLGTRVVVGGLLLVAALVVPFALADPGALARSVVEFHLHQPFRADSDSLLVASVLRFGWPPPWSYGVLPLVAGLVVALLLAGPARRSPGAFAAATGLTLLSTVLLSKQALPNYFWLVQMCFVAAAAVGLGWQPEGEPEDAGSVRQITTQTRP